MIDRRNFARLISLAAAAAPAIVTSAAPARRILKPKALQPGDTIALISPASAAFEDDTVTFAKEQMEALGFKVVLGQHATGRHGYFAGTDRQRADDVNRAFANDDVDGIVCYTGGWGSPRILPLLDYDLIARKPKVFVGFSDITSLLLAIHQRTGLVTFHGPVGGSAFDTFTAHHFRKVIMTSEPAGLQPAPDKPPQMLVDRRNRIITLAPGKASGRLIGGNLTMIASTMGTPYEIETDGAILFLEDIGEELYRIDRMLTQLALGGKFDRLAGFVFGRCTDCKYDGPTFSLEEILRDRFGSLKAPALSGLSFGHIEQKLTFPIGIMATLDADARTLTIDEAATVAA